MCTYTHLLHAQFSAYSACTVKFAHFHACAHTRLAQVSVKRCLHMCLFSPSRFLHTHGSPVFAVPARSLRRHVLVRVLAELSRPKSAGQAHLRTSTEEFGYLAKSGLNTGYEPKEFDKITVDDPALENISEFSRVTQESTGLTSITTMCGPISVFASFLW